MGGGDRRWPDGMAAMEGIGEQAHQEDGRRAGPAAANGGCPGWATGDWQQAAAHGDGGGAWVERDREMLKPMLLLVDYLSHYI